MLVKKLSNQLFDYLNEVNAKFPEKDPEYSVELEDTYLNKIRTQK